MACYFHSLKRVFNDIRLTRPEENIDIHGQDDLQGESRMKQIGPASLFSLHVGPPMKLQGMLHREESISDVLVGLLEPSHPWTQNMGFLTFQHINNGRLMVERILDKPS
ncbi:uncharacterized protein PADG_11692 [Paracoccidioides brasiliensis Pb18]|uniref:Uncharacterized protein n=1 Tax=Paracoccidioides brasiliensis (strain Pb18) TaxID=502780 RepID=A0A0A0HXP7_PARBD|nr:uncharacterized protein PADG_11692 [Paracoccidioides brasiliensis Pb18]KGM92155.1 hypothetical protein PADG_11692 [Paracoccidioides brasiliensis Pb18]